MPRWHASTYLCALLGCSRDVPKGNTGGGNSQSDNDEPKENNALDIHLDLHVMAYLHVGEVLVGLTPKECVVLKKNNWLKSYFYLKDDKNYVKGLCIKIHFICLSKH